MGKRAARAQARAMAQMNKLAQEQFDYYRDKQAAQEISTAEQRAEFEAFRFENPFASIRNPYADMQTDFENLYEGMENPYEDLTVDMKAAEFQAQQGQQQRADILSALQGAAGTSGIAGLAQSLANQGALQAQQIAAGIGQQEAANRRLAAQGAMEVQQLQIQGEEQARALGISREELIAQGGFQTDVMQREGAAAVQAAEFGRESTLLGAEYGLLAGTSAGLQGAMSNQMSALGMQSQMYGQQAQAQMGMVTGIGTAVIGTKAKFICIPKGINIDTIDGGVAIEDIKPGDIVVGYNGDPVKVLQKHEYLEDPKLERFYKVEFNNGSIVNVCDMHRIKGERAMDITEDVKSKEVYSGVNYSYDLLTEDAGYRIDDIPVNSMIEELALAISDKIKNK